MGKRGPRLGSGGRPHKVSADLFDEFQRLRMQRSRAKKRGNFGLYNELSVKLVQMRLKLGELGKLGNRTN